MFNKKASRFKKMTCWSNYIRVYGIHVLGWLIVTNLLKMHVYTYTRLLWGKLSGSARGRKEARKIHGYLLRQHTCRITKEYASTSATRMWLLESLTCKELAQDSEDWLQSNVSVDIWIYTCLAGPHKEINQWRRKVS